MATTKPNFPINFEVHNVKQAVDLVEAILRRAGYKNIIRHPENDGAHWMISGVEPTGMYKDIFYIKWEKELFHKAGVLVPQLRGTRGACTINVEYARKALEFNCTILFASAEDRMIYEVDASFFMRNSFERPQDLTMEVTRCIAVESLKPWGLGLQHGMGLQQQQPATSSDESDAVLLLRCLDCGYARIQTKQDTKGVELKKLGWGDKSSHSRIFNHHMEITRISKNDPLALKLRDRLQRWEKW